MKRFFLVPLLMITTNVWSQISFNENTIIEASTSAFNPKSILLFDVDNDGDNDLIVASQFDDKISWYKNLDGEGTFGPQNIVSTLADAVISLHANDINGDGLIDIVSASVVDDEVAWYPNLGGQVAFGPQQIISSTAQWARSVFSFDVDGDGDIDVLSASRDDNTIAWYENLDGMGNFGSTNVINANALEAAAVQAGDIDGDGDTDVVSASFLDDTIQWYENIDGQGSFGSGTVVSSASDGAYSVFLEDIDGDNDLDIVGASRQDNTVSWYENLDGNGSFSSIQIIDLALEDPWNVFVVDIDGDSDLDVLSGSSTTDEVVWYENLDGQATFGSAQIINQYADQVEFVTAGDVDGDGDMDALSASNQDDKIAWYKNLDGNGDFGTQNIVTYRASAASAIDAVDFDGDGDLDVLAAAQSVRLLTWFENVDGDGRLGPPLVVDPILTGENTAIGSDLDGDGDQDILVASGFENSVFWYENTDGLGQWGPRSIVTDQAMSATSAYAADIDNDGDLDVISSSTQDNKVAWYENVDGMGNFGGEQVVSNVAMGARDIYAADLDGDNDLDVLAANASPGELVWYENLDGQGSFSPKIVISSSTVGAWSTRAADFDADGDLDVAVAVGFQDEIIWYENLDGNGNFGLGTVISVNINNPQDLTLADVDSDGDIDIIAAMGNLNRASWYENTDGGGNFGSEQIIGTNLDGAISVSSGDMDNDGDLDVLAVGAANSKFAWYENDIDGNRILGTVRQDIDSNGCDASDLGLGYLRIESTDGSETFSTFTQLNGTYAQYVEEGTYTTEIALLPSYYVSDPVSHDSGFTGIGNVDVADFCLEATETISDLNIVLYPLQGARPGFEARYRLLFRNVGTTSVSNGTVELTFDETRMEFVSATATVSSQTNGNLVFDYTNLDPFETQTIDVLFDIEPPPITEIGDLLIFQAVVQPISGDDFPTDNTFEFIQLVIGSFDPNDIQVLEGEEITVDEVDNFLHYIIRFQNTGTADAINVRVTNELDPNLDWNTMQLESLSHPGRVEITDGNFVEFIFDDINLPPQSTSEQDSQGQIAYKIKPINTIGIGDSISNNANIFFDYNLPIMTNTVTTTVVEDLGVSDVDQKTFIVHPNPVTEWLNITSSIPIVAIEVLDIQGRTLFEKTDERGIDRLYTGNLSSGYYFLKLQDAEGIQVLKRLVKR